jgi:hypothetical protein
MFFKPRLIWALFPLLALGSAHAVGLNQMSATAFENTVSTDTQTSGVSQTVPVTAAVIDGASHAAASATLLRLTAGADSRDLQTHHFDAIAAQWSSFTFWNTATGAAYSAADLAGLTLTLDFVLSGEVDMPGPPKDGNARSTGYTYSAALYAIDPVSESGGGSLGCGPSGCVGTGSPLHLGNNLIDRRFALSTLITAPVGLLDTYLSVIDGGGTSSALTLEVHGASVSGGAPLPLALRFDDGSLYNVSAVPEPQSLTLCLSSVCVGLWATRRQRRA